MSEICQEYIIDNMPTIPLDLLMDTSPPVKTNANGSRAGLSSTPRAELAKAKSHKSEAPTN